MNHLSQLVDLLWSNDAVRQLAVSLLLVILTALTTHYFDVKKIKEQQKISLQESVEKRIVEACIGVRDLLLDGRTQEIFQVERIGKDRFRPTISDSAVYPSYATDQESFLKYCMQIRETRRLNDPYLSVKSTAFLLTYEQYFLELSHLIGSTNSFERLQLIGAITMIDVQKIRKAFDDVLIKEINRPKQFLESKNTRKYEKFRKKYWTEYIEHSVLMKMKRDDVVKNLLANQGVPEYKVVERISALCFGETISGESKELVTT